MNEIEQIVIPQFITVLLRYFFFSFLTLLLKHGELIARMLAVLHVTFTPVSTHLKASKATCIFISINCRILLTKFIFQYCMPYI